MSAPFATDEVLDLQRMLVFYGFGPLSLDGKWGPKTDAARRAFLDLPREWSESDTRTRDSLLTLHPRAADEAAAHLEAVRDGDLDGAIVRIISGRRSWPEQSRIYAQGRTTPGPIVTRAKPGSSRHQYGISWDLGLFYPDGRYMTGKTARERELYRLAATVRRNHVFWGGLFPTSDPPHYHLDGWKIGDLRKLWMTGEFLKIA